MMKERIQSGPISPIPHADGAAAQDKAKFSFVYMYADEDVMYTIEEIFPETEVKCTLEARERVVPLWEAIKKQKVPKLGHSLNRGAGGLTRRVGCPTQPIW